MSNPNSGGAIYFTTDGSDPRAPGGAIAASASAYDEPTAIAPATRIRARVLAGDDWSAVADAEFE